MRSSDAPVKCVDPGRPPWIGLATILAALHSVSIRADTNPPSVFVAPPPFTITHLAYATNGTLSVAPESMRANVTSFFYGEPVTNLVFRAELPAANGASPSSAAPAHLDRPLFRIDRWDREQGLPANKVNALLQSRDGYLWIGTVDGVARFDGVRLKVFNDANTPAMRTNGTVGRALLEDESGQIWIATERGMLRYANGGFVGFAGQEELRGHDLRCLARRSAGGFWFGTDDRLGFWDGSAIRWETTIQSENESGSRIMSLAEDGTAKLWIGTVGGLWSYSPESRALAHKGRRATAYSTMFMDRHQTLWIGSSRGVWRLPRSAPEPIPIGDPNPRMRILPHAASFAEDAEGNIWATTGLGEGIFQLREGPDGIITTTLAEELNETLCILVDREGVIWIGARDLGLIRLRLQPIATVAFGSRGILDHVRSVAEGTDGSLWFASRAGFGHWTGRDITLIETREMGRQRTSPIFVRSSGAVWTSFPTGGVFEPFSGIEGPQKLRPAVPLLRGIGEVQGMAARRDGSVCIGTTNGLFRTDGTSNTVRIPGLSHRDIRAVLEAREGALWIGTARGLNRVGENETRVSVSRDGLSSESVNALHESDDGTLWIGTDAGLCRLRGGGIASFDTGSGLPQHAIHCLLEDDSGRLWISHAAGVARVARSELEAWLQDPSRAPAVAELGSADGIVNPEMSTGSQPSGVKSRDGRLWFSNRNGLIVVDPAKCPTGPSPKVLIEEITADGKVLATDSALEFPPGAGGFVDIRFTTTSLHSPERVRFRYRLDGYDRDWRDAGTTRHASYADLQPGRYQFHVRARNHEGRWSERDATLGFRIAPRFWQTWPFRLACGIALAEGITGLVILRVRNERRRLEAERVRGLELERRRIARDMHDHLGAQLAGIALASGANESAHQRVRESLRELNDLIWSVHPGNDTLPSLADFIANFASRYLSAAGIELELDLPDRIPPTPIPSQLRRELAAMFKEALRNVTQHAQARRVVIRLRIDGDRLTLAIRDNGRGFDAALGGRTPPPERAGEADPIAASGNGLRNFHIRSEILGGRCRIHSAPQQGTEIEFSVPLERAQTDGT